MQCNKNNDNQCQQTSKNFTNKIYLFIHFFIFIAFADHSDDPRHLSMRTALFAHGPVFKNNHINEPILMTDIYILLRQILCLSPLTPSKNELFHIHNMLDLTSLSNTCAYLYLSSINMLKSVSIKPVEQTYIHDENLQYVQINITERYQIPSKTLIQMRVIID